MGHTDVMKKCFRFHTKVVILNLILMLFIGGLSAEPLEELSKKYLLQKIRIGLKHEDTIKTGMQYASALVDAGQAEKAYIFAEEFCKPLRHSFPYGSKQSVELLVFCRNIILPESFKPNLWAELKSAGMLYGMPSQNYANHLNQIASQITYLIEKKHPFKFGNKAERIEEMNKMNQTLKLYSPLIQQLTIVSGQLSVMASQNKDIKAHKKALFYQGMWAVKHWNLGEARHIFGELSNMKGEDSAHVQWAKLLVNQLKTPSSSNNKELQAFVNVYGLDNVGINMTNTVYIQERRRGTAGMFGVIRAVPFNPAYTLLAREKNIEEKTLVKSLKVLEDAVDGLLISESLGVATDAYVDALTAYVDTLYALPLAFNSKTSEKETRVLENEHELRTLFYSHKISRVAVERINHFLNIYPLLSDIDIGNRLQHIIFTLAVEEIAQGDETAAERRLDDLIKNYTLVKGNSKYISYAMSYLIGKAQLYRNKALETSLTERAKVKDIKIIPIANPESIWKNVEMVDLNTLMKGDHPIASSFGF